MLAEADRLAGAAATKKLREAVAATSDLLKANNAVASDKAGAATLRRVLIIVAQKESPDAADLYRLVGTSQREAGPDLLYKLIETSGKAVWASAATKALKDESVREHASKALLASFDLRVAPCNEKLALIDAAVASGDDRALVVLDIHARGCTKDAKRIDVAIDSLQRRLERQRRGK